jgi:hypothetical protein
MVPPVQDGSGYPRRPRTSDHHLGLSGPGRVPIGLSPFLPTGTESPHLGGYSDGRAIWRRPIGGQRGVVRRLVAARPSSVTAPDLVAGEVADVARAGPP